MKLFTANCHERATLRKLWRQTENSSLLSAKCWPLLHVIRACIWRWPNVAGISSRFSKFGFVLSIHQNCWFEPFVLPEKKYLDDWSLAIGEQWIFFPSNLNVLFILFFLFTNFTTNDENLRAWSTGHEFPYEDQPHNNNTHAHTHTRKTDETLRTAIYIIRTAFRTKCLPRSHTVDVEIRVKLRQVVRE